MSDFWDHLFNAIGHGLDAQQLAARERATQRSKAPSRKRAQKPAPGAEPGSFSEPADPDCCVAKRGPALKLKLK
jgi:hypothetical protein